MSLTKPTKAKQKQLNHVLFLFLPTLRSSIAPWIQKEATSTSTTRYQRACTHLLLLLTCFLSSYPQENISINLQARFAATSFWWAFFFWQLSATGALTAPSERWYTSDDYSCQRQRAFTKAACPQLPMRNCRDWPELAGCWFHAHLTPCCLAARSWLAEQRCPVLLSPALVEAEQYHASQLSAARNLKCSHPREPSRDISVLLVFIRNEAFKNQSA